MSDLTAFRTSPPVADAPVEMAADASFQGPAVSLPTTVRLNDLQSSAEMLSAPSAFAERGASVQGALRLAAALLGYGLPVFRVEEALSRLTKALGLRVHSLGLPRALMVSIEDERHSRAVFVPAEPGVVDLDRLSSLHELVGAVEDGRLSSDRVDAEVGRILDSTPHYPAWAVVLASTLCGWGAAPVLGGGLLDANAGALLGLFVGGLLWLTARKPGLALVLPVIAGTLVSAAAVAATPIFGLSGAVVLSAGLLPLLPGLSITVAMMELGAGHSVCGTSRLVGAGTVLLQLGFGALVGARVGGQLHAPAELPVAVHTPLWLLVSAVAALTLGITVLVQVRRRDLGWALLISTLAIVVSRFASGPYGPEVGALLSAATVGVLSNAFARAYDRPASVLLVPGVSMLVPGCLGLLSLSALVGPDPLGALQTASHVLMVAVALSLGVLLSTAVLPARSAL